ncbi:MAG TPA: DUF3047 domain-containing protein, partial [Rhodospirillales bacterium]|nr:DUF3047 domain-containing protein [Rhodospirillales bacterium]
MSARMVGKCALLLLGSVLIGGLLSGCTAPRAAMTPEGLLAVLGPVPGFTAAQLPDDWVVESNGEISQQQLRVVSKDGVQALRIANGKNAFIVVRRTQAMLLSTPFLSWSWNIEPPSAPGFHPVRVIVGFHGGNPASGSWGSQPLKWLGSRLPPHDRAISLTWGESALQRGVFEISQAIDARAAPRYTVRGGRENAGTWWREDVDLADLYARAWPGDDVGRAQIMFIGIATPPN